LMFEHLEFPTAHFTRGPSGYFSTDENILKYISNSRHHAKEAAIYILELRTLRKLSSTYNKPLFGRIKNGRVFSHFNSTGTTTGRFSSSDPNMQNIPTVPFIKGNPESSIRNLFVPDKDKVFINADYSQIELRIMAELSQDPVMCKAYRENADIHQVTADHLRIPRSSAKQR
jgi:DNA polymerase-1